MMFEARELKSYAEPVTLGDLREGEVYFVLQFADEALLIPIMQPLIFLGKNLEEGDIDLFYFQDFESYAGGVRYASRAEEGEADFSVYGPNDTNHIFEYERALDRLMVCSLRRRNTK